MDRNYFLGRIRELGARVDVHLREFGSGGIMRLNRVKESIIKSGGKFVGDALENNAWKAGEPLSKAVARNPEWANVVKKAREAQGRRILKIQDGANRTLKKNGGMARRYDYRVPGAGKVKLSDLR